MRLVSCCDKLHNAHAILSDYQELGDALWGRFNAGRDDLLWYYRSLADAFQEAQERHGERPIRAVTELASLVGDLERPTQEPDHGRG